MRIIILIVSSVLLAQGSSLRRDFRIVGGEEVPTIRAFPYIASLRYIKPRNSFYCGATIVHPRWVLTTAYNVVNKPRRGLFVSVGTATATEEGTIREIERYVPHEDFDQARRENDIALVKLKYHLILNKKIQPLALPTEDVKVGVSLIVAGFGTTDYEGVSPVDELNWLNVTTISLTECDVFPSGLPPVTENKLCTYTKRGEGICSVDHGGPLTDGKALVGIVSHGLTCAQGYPDVYTRVFAYKQWIEDNMQ